MELTKWLLEGEEYGDYFEEIHKYQVDRRLPEFNVGQRIDLWWNSVIKSNEYPALSVVVKAALSIFTGLQIEASFSIRHTSRSDVNLQDKFLKKLCSLEFDGYAHESWCK